MKTLLPILCTILLASSCTIQKRGFRSGYHVEWNHKFRSAGSQEAERKHVSGEHKKETTIDPAEDSKPMDSFTGSNNADSKAPASEPVNEEKSRVAEEIHEPDHPYDFPPDTTQVEQQVMSMTAPELADNAGHKKIVPLSWAALGMSLTYIGLLTLIVQGILNPSFIALCVVTFVLTLALSIISINKYRHNKTRYRRPQIAVLAIALAGGSTVFIMGIWCLYMIGQAFNAVVGGFLGALFGGMN